MHPRAALLSTALCLFAHGASAADGLAAPDGRVLWPQWQARLSLTGTQLVPVSLVDRGGLSTSVVVGDYYFNAPGLRLPASMGGLRASSGLLSTSLRGPLGVSAETQPYFGIGYTGLAVKGGWGVTADLGLALENPAGAKGLGRAVFGNQGFDGALRELRLSPVLQLGVRYAF